MRPIDLDANNNFVYLHFSALEKQKQHQQLWHPTASYQPQQQTNKFYSFAIFHPSHTYRLLYQYKESFGTGSCPTVNLKAAVVYILLYDEIDTTARSGRDSLSIKASAITIRNWVIALLPTKAIYHWLKLPKSPPHLEHSILTHTSIFTFLVSKSFTLKAYKFPHFLCINSRSYTSQNLTKPNTWGIPLETKTNLYLNTQIKL